MAWEEGTTGNPTGRPKDSKLWQDALRRALKRMTTGKIDFAKLDQIAEKVINMAAAGDMIAVKEIADRLDGKVINHLVIENRTAFDEMPLDELSNRDKELTQRIERLQTICLPSPSETKTGSISSV